MFRINSAIYLFACAKALDAGHTVPNRYSRRHPGPTVRSKFRRENQGYQKHQYKVI